MILKKLTIRSFGELRDRTMEFSPGIQLLYGENEAKKRSIYTFIKYMLYGSSEQRAHEEYEGSLWAEEEGELFCITRASLQEKEHLEIRKETDGETSKEENGILADLLGGVSETVYENTMSVKRPRGISEPDLAKEIQRKLTGFQNAADTFADLGRADQMLKMWRKGYQVQQEKGTKEIHQEEEKLVGRIEQLNQELEELAEVRSRMAEQNAALSFGSGQGNISADSRLQERMERLKQKRLGMSVGILVAVLLGITALFARFRITDGMSGFGLDICVVLAIGAIVYFLLRRDRLGADLEKVKKQRAKLHSRQEKLQESHEDLSEIYKEKRTAFCNLQEDYQEFAQQSGLQSSAEREIQALNLAIDTIDRLSCDIRRQVGYRLRQRISAILKEVSGNELSELLMVDEQLAVSTINGTVPLNQLGGEKLLLVYFAMHMAAGNLFCGDTKFPIFLEEILEMYSEKSIVKIFHWMERQERQFVICTTGRREEEILKRERIAFDSLQL